MTTPTKEHRPITGRSLLELLPNELLIEVFRWIDSSTLRNVLLEFTSTLSHIGVVVVAHENDSLNADPHFFDIPGMRRGTIDDPLLKGFLLKLFDIRTGYPGLGCILEGEYLWETKSLSFIHLSGPDVSSVMGRPSFHRAMRCLDAKHTPRISFHNTESESKQEPSMFQNCLEYVKCFIFETGSRDKYRNIREHPFRFVNWRRRGAHIQRSLGMQEHLAFPFELDPLVLESKPYMNLLHLEVNTSLSVVSGIEIPWLKTFSITLILGQNHIPTLQDIRLPMLRRFSVKYHQIMPLIYEVSAGNGASSIREGSCFELMDVTAFDLHCDIFENDTMTFASYELMNLEFAANFHNHTYVGCHEIIVFGFPSIMNVRSILWYDTVSFSTSLNSRWAASLKKRLLDEKLHMSRLTVFRYITKLPQTHIPKLFAPKLSHLSVYTNNKGLNLNSIAGASGRAERRLSGGFVHVDICCDLPKDRIGTADHYMMGYDELRCFLCSKKLVFLSISGCILGYNNTSLKLSIPGFSHPRYFGRSIDGVNREISLNLVRTKYSCIYEAKSSDSLEFRLLTFTEIPLARLKISQIVGEGQHKPWDSITVHLFGHEHSDAQFGRFPLGFKLLIDDRFKTLTVPKGGLLLEAGHTQNASATSVLGSGSGGTRKIDRFLMKYVWKFNSNRRQYQFIQAGSERFISL